jgi:stearoyl-CoA desaturase (delta-9 desaturase)
VNWFGHWRGYRNFDTSDRSCNTLCIELVTCGELFQNNHHRYPLSPNFAKRWFELDPAYPLIVLFDRLGVIQLPLDETCSSSSGLPIG